MAAGSIFDKTTLVLHAGLAFGAFHHFIYNPFKDGAFKSGTSGRIKALVRAALAGAFTVHELRLVKADAESSPTLCHIVGRRCMSRRPNRASFASGRALSSLVGVGVLLAAGSRAELNPAVVLAVAEIVVVTTVGFSPSSWACIPSVMYSVAG